MKRGEDTKEAILDAGLLLARSGGLSAVTARGVALAVGRAHTGVRYYFKGETALRDAVAQLAIDRGDRVVLARMILDRHPLCSRLTDDARRAIMLSAAD